jgi:hypothetical protein
MSTLVFADREVGTIVIKQSQRRVDLRWVATPTPPNWRVPPPSVNAALHQSCRLGRRYSLYIGEEDRYVIACGDIEVKAEESVSAVRSQGRLFLLPGTPIGSHLIELFDRIDSPANGRISSDASHFFRSLNIFFALL